MYDKFWTVLTKYCNHLKYSKVPKIKADSVNFSREIQTTKRRVPITLLILKINEKKLDSYVQNRFGFLLTKNFKIWFSGCWEILMLPMRAEGRWRKTTFKNHVTCVVDAPSIKQVFVFLWRDFWPSFSFIFPQLA